jgi:hypothetical protein
MSHASLASNGLLWLIIAFTLLLALFVLAAIREPLEASRPSSGMATSPEPAPPPPPLPRREPISPTADAVSQKASTGYPPRHATSGGPPWGPVPKPPGIERDQAW